MEPQERELITTLLTRLQSTRGQAKDPEADAMIRQAMTQLPDAPYYLVQTVLIQDLSLQNAQGRIAELEQQLAALPAPQQQPTSFLGGLFGRSQSQAPTPPSSGGPWTRAPQAAPPPPPQYAQPQYAQPQYAPQPGYAQAAPPQGGGMFGGAAGGGNSFLKSAAATAAGVAGGALLFQGISSLFGHSYASGLGGMGGGMPGGLSETVVNNYYGDSQGGGDYGGGSDAGYAGGGDAGYAGGGDYGGGGGDYGGGGDSGWDSGGGDFGGGGDDSYNC